MEYREKKARDKGYNPAQCSHRSSVEIDGKPYCTRHAGQVALRLLVEATD